MLVVNLILIVTSLATATEAVSSQPSASSEPVDVRLALPEFPS